MTTARVEITKHHGHYFLWIDDDCWMWDFALEVEAQQELAGRARGDVLVAGYGLGILQSTLVGRVKSVLTVEKYPDVVRANRRAFGQLHGKVVVGDFFDVDEDGVRYDTVIGDIWLEVSPRYVGDWRAFRDKARRLIRSGGQVIAWGDDCFEVWGARQ